MKKIICCLVLLLGVMRSNSQNIIAMEYFVDVDNGFGQCIPLTGLPALADIPNFPFTVPATLPIGIHTVGVRSMDANNRWSLTNFYSFEVVDTSNALMTELEYFWDADPGFNNATDTILGSPLADLSNGILYAHVPVNLGAGNHILFVRSRESRNRWSHTNYTQNVLVGLTELSEIEEVSVYPNPVTDKLTLSAEKKSEVRFVLYDESGRLLIDKFVKGHTEIDMSEFSSGTYTVFVWIDKIKIYRSQLVKN